MPSRALAVAAVAGVLLTVVVAADVAMNRYYHLEAQLEGRWIKVATFPFSYDERYAMGPSLVAFGVNASDAVPMRLRVENGYPWAFSEPAQVRVGGRVVLEDTLAAPARQEGVLSFTAQGEDLLDARGPYDPPVKEAAPGRVGSPYFEVRVGRDVFGGNLALREVAK